MKHSFHLQWSFISPPLRLTPVAVLKDFPTNCFEDGITATSVSSHTGSLLPDVETCLIMPLSSHSICSQSWTLPSHREPELSSVGWGIRGRSSLPCMSSGGQHAVWERRESNSKSVGKLNPAKSCWWILILVGGSGNSQCVTTEFTHEVWFNWNTWQNDKNDRSHKSVT